MLYFAAAHSLALPFMPLFSTIDVTVPRDKNPNVRPSPPAPLTFSQRAQRVTNPILHAMPSCPLANGEFKGDCIVTQSVRSDGMNTGEVPYI